MGVIVKSCGSEVGVSCRESRQVGAFLPVREAVGSGSQAARDLSVAPLVVEATPIPKVIDETCA